MIRKIIIIILLFYIFFLSITLYNWPKKIEILGNTYLSNSRIINISKKDGNIEEILDDNFSGFSKLKEVNFENINISKEEKDKLIDKYPNIKFNVVAYIDLYGLKINEDVTNINLREVEIDDKLIDYIKYFPNLNEIDFGETLINKDYQYKLVDKYPNINFKWKVKILDLTVDNNIETLNLDKLEVKDKKDFINSLKLLNNLTYLDMGDSNLSNDELEELRNIFPNTKIAWTIHFGVWHIKTDDVAFSVLISNFPYKRLTSDDLSFLKYCHDLQALDLGHQRITDITPITDNLPNLRILILADNKISDIKPLKKLKKLHYLELFINNINDISILIENKELVDVNLCFNNIKDYSSLLNLPKLERLWVVGARFSDNDYNKFKEKYPNILISRFSGGSTGNGWRGHSRYYAMIDMFHKRNYISEEFSKYD